MSIGRGPFILPVGELTDRCRGNWRLDPGSVGVCFRDPPSSFLILIHADTLSSIWHGGSSIAALVPSSMRHGSVHKPASIFLSIIVLLRKCFQMLFAPVTRRRVGGRRHCLPSFSGSRVMEALGWNKAKVVFSRGPAMDQTQSSARQPYTVSPGLGRGGGLSANHKIPMIRGQ